MPDLLEQFPNYAADIERLRSKGYEEESLKNILARYHLEDLEKQGKLSPKQKMAFESARLSPTSVYYDTLQGIKSNANDGTVMGRMRAKKDPTLEVDPSYWATFKGAVSRSVDNVQGMGYGLLGMAGDAIGSEELSNAGIAGYQRNMGEAQQAGGKQVTLTQLWESDEKLNDFLHFAAGAIGENIPTMATMVAGGGIGGLLAKKVAEKAITKQTAKVISQKLEKSVMEAAMKKIAEGGAAKVAFGQTAGAGLASMGMEAGGIYGDIYDKTGQKRAGVAAGFGAVAGMFDALPVVAMMKRVSPAGAGKFTEQLAEWMGSGKFHERFLKGGMLEAGTEGAQTIIERAAVKFVDENQDIFTPEGAKEIIDAMGAGGFGGGFFSGVLGKNKANVGNENDSYQRKDGTVVDADGNPVVQDLGNTKDWGSNATPQAEATTQQPENAEGGIPFMPAPSEDENTDQAPKKWYPAPDQAPEGNDGEGAAFMPNPSEEQEDQGPKPWYPAIEQDQAEPSQDGIPAAPLPYTDPSEEVSPWEPATPEEQADNTGKGIPYMQEGRQEGRPASTKKSRAEEAKARSQRNSPPPKPAKEPAPVIDYSKWSDAELSKERQSRGIQAKGSWTRPKLIAALKDHDQKADERAKAFKAEYEASLKGKPKTEQAPAAPQEQATAPELTPAQRIEAAAREANTESEITKLTNRKIELGKALIDEAKNPPSFASDEQYKKLKAEFEKVSESLSRLKSEPKTKLDPSKMPTIPSESRMQELDEGAEFKNKAEQDYYEERVKNQPDEERKKREAPTKEKDSAIQNVRNFFGIDDNRGLELDDGADASEQELHLYDLANRHQADLERAISDGDMEDAQEIVAKINKEYNGKDGRTLSLHGDIAAPTAADTVGRGTGDGVQNQPVSQTLAAESGKNQEVGKQTPAGETEKVESNAPSTSPVESSETVNAEQEDYSKLPIPELKALLVKRGLTPTSGSIHWKSQAEGIKALQDDNAKKNSESATGGSRKDDAPKGAPSAPNINNFKKPDGSPDLEAYDKAEEDWYKSQNPEGKMGNGIDPEITNKRIAIQKKIDNANKRLDKVNKQSASLPPPIRIEARRKINEEIAELEKELVSLASGSDKVKLSPNLRLAEESGAVWDDEYKGKRYTYGLHYRSLSSAQLPRDGQILQSYKTNKEDGRANEGTIQFTRPLTAEEMRVSGLIDLDAKAPAETTTKAYEDLSPQELRKLGEDRGVIKKHEVISPENAIKRIEQDDYRIKRLNKALDFYMIHKKDFIEVYKKYTGDDRKYWVQEKILARGALTIDKSDYQTLLNNLDEAIKKEIAKQEEIDAQKKEEPIKSKDETGNSKEQKIFGRDFSEIQAMQQGNKTGYRMVNMNTAKPQATKEDFDLMKEKGFQWLEDQKYFGVIDRLNNSGYVKEEPDLTAKQEQFVEATGAKVEEKPKAETKAKEKARLLGSFAHLDGFIGEEFITLTENKEERDAAIKLAGQLLYFADVTPEFARYPIVTVKSTWLEFSDGFKFKLPMEQRNMSRFGWSHDQIIAVDLNGLSEHVSYTVHKPADPKTDAAHVSFREGGKEAKKGKYAEVLERIEEANGRPVTSYKGAIPSDAIIKHGVKNSTFINGIKRFIAHGRPFIQTEIMVFEGTDSRSDSIEERPAPKSQNPEDDIFMKKGLPVDSEAQLVHKRKIVKKGSADKEVTTIFAHLKGEGFETIIRWPIWKFLVNNFPNATFEHGSGERQAILLREQDGRIVAFIAPIDKQMAEGIISEGDSQEFLAQVERRDAKKADEKKKAPKGRKNYGRSEAEIQAKEESEANDDGDELNPETEPDFKDQENAINEEDLLEITPEQQTILDNARNNLEPEIGKLEDFEDSSIRPVFARLFDPEPSLEDIDNAISSIDDDSTVEEFRTAFKAIRENEEHIKSLLNKFNLADLKKKMFMYGSGYKKADYVKGLYNSILHRFFPKSIQYDPMKETSLQYMDRIIESITQEDVDKQIAEKKKLQADRQEQKEGIKNPKTLAQFRAKARVFGRDNMTVDELRRWDEAVAYNTIQEREKEQAKKSILAQVELGDTSMEMIKTKHTQKGHDLWVVKLSDRISKESYSDLNIKAKRLGGYYSSFRGNGAIPGFQFKSEDDAKNFIALKEGDVDNKERVEQRKQSKLEATLERLRAMGDNIEAKGEEDLNANRKTNTAKRAREAASSERDAARRINFAKTLKNIIEGIENGDVVILNGIKAATHLETLEAELRHAMWTSVRKNKEPYSESREPQFEDIDALDKPRGGTVRPDIIRDAVVQVRNVDGMKMLVNKILKWVEQSKEDAVEMPSDIEEAVNEIRSKLARSSSSNAKTAKTILDNATESNRRFEAMGIEGSPMIRAALREYYNLRSNSVKPDPIKVKEREIMRSLSKEKGFFPTPKDIAVDMVQQAEIEPGMKVLEPSGGKGNIADEIRNYAPEAKLDVIEKMNSLRELLKLKGHNIVGDDFLKFDIEGDSYDRILMNPPFENGQDIEHVMKAFEILAPGGKLIAITSESPFFRNDAKSEEFRQFVNQYGKSEKMEAGSFLNAERSTGVNTRMVTLNKPDTSDKKYSKLDEGEETAYDDEDTAPDYSKDQTDETTGTTNQATPTEENAPVISANIREIFANIRALKNESKALRKVKILIKHAGKDFRGYYDEKTGEVVINADVIKNMDDLRAIMQHEDLVHRWLKAGDSVTYNSLVFRIMQGDKAFAPFVEKVRGLNANDKDVKGQYFEGDKLTELGAEEVLAYWVQANPMADTGDGRYYWHLVKKLANYIKKYLPFVEATERDVSDIMMDGFYKYTAGKGGPKGDGPNGGKKFSKESDKTVSKYESKGFKNSLDIYLDGKGDPYKMIEVMKTPMVLKMIGAQDLPVKMNPHILKKILPPEFTSKAKNLTNPKREGGTHDLTPDMVKALPAAIENPIAVFDGNDSKKGIKGFVVMTEIVDSKGKSVIVPIHLDKAENHYSMNYMASAYGIENPKWFYEQFGNLREKYSHRKKAQRWHESKGMSFPKERTPLLNFSSQSLSEVDLASREGDEGLKNDTPLKYSKLDQQAKNEIADFVKRQLPEQDWPDWIRKWLPSTSAREAKDMSKVYRHLTTLSFKAKKYGGALKEMMNRAMDRVNHRVEIASQLQEMVAPYTELSLDDRKAVDTILNLGDKENTDFSKDNYANHPKVKNLTDGQKAALKGIRQMFNTVKEKLINDVKAENQKLSTFLPTAAKADYKKMFDMMAKVGALRAKISVETGHLAWSFKGTDSYRSTETEIKRLEKELGGKLAILEELKREIANIEAKDDSAVGIRKEIEKNVDYIENLKKQDGYFPRIRDKGLHLSYWDAKEKTFVREVFEDNDSNAGQRALDAKIAELTKGGKVNDETLGMEYKALAARRFKGELDDQEYEDAKRELRKRSYKFERTIDAPEDLFRSKASDSVLTMMNNAMQEAGMEGKGLEAANDAIRTMFYSRGWRKHLLARQGELVVGYKSENLHEVLNTFIHGFAGITSKAEAARNYYQILQSVDVKKQPEIYGNLVDIMRDELRNSDSTDKISNMLNGLVYHTYLGFRASTALINSTQNFLLGIPALGNHLRKAQLESHKKIGNAAGFELTAAKDFAVAMKHAGAYMFAKSKAKHGQAVSVAGLKPEEVKFLDMEYDRIMKSDLTREMTDQLQAGKGKVGKALGELSKWSSWMFSKTEQMNRLSALLVYQRYFAKDQTDMVTLEGLRRPAELFVQDVHFSYEKWNQLDMFKNPTMRIMKPFLFALASYNQNLYQSLANMDWRSRGAFVVALTLMAGIPLEDLWEDELMDWFGTNSHAALGTGAVGKMARMGVPGAFGVNLSGSIALNPPPMLSAVLEMAGFEDLNKGPLQDIFANAWLVAKDPADFNNLKQHFPMLAVKSALQAYGEYEDGLTTKKGKPMLYDGKIVKRGEVDAVAKGLGFNTSEIVDIKSKHWRDKQLSEKFSERKAEMVENYIKSPLTQRAKMMPEIEKFNKELEASRKEVGTGLDVEPITGKTISEKLRKQYKEQARVAK